MEKFPILCTLSALIVFLGAAIGAAGVQTGKTNNLPFGSNSVEQIQKSVPLMNVLAGHRQDVKVFGKFNVPEEGRVLRAGTSVIISGDLLVSF